VANVADPTSPVGLETARAAGDRLSAMAETTKWEYATVPLIVHATKQILDQWGEDGWELVQVLVNPDSGGLVAYLKRPLA
jgi:hypothetical protein